MLQLMKLTNFWNQLLPDDTYTAYSKRCIGIKIDFAADSRQSWFKFEKVNQETMQFIIHPKLNIGVVATEQIVSGNS